MDTLSRKHRLRQQARNQQEHQQFFTKESRQFTAAANDYHKLECARVSSLEANNNLNISSNNNNGMEEDEEQFRVFKLVEIGRRERREARNLVEHNNNNNNNKNGNNSTHWREQENDDEVYLTHTLPRGRATATGGQVTKCNGQTNLGPKPPSASIVYLARSDSNESTSRRADLEQRTSGNSTSSLKLVYTAGGSNGTSNFMDFSTGSTRSTGYSSGAFMSSEASSTAGGPPSSYRSPLQPVESNEHKRQAEAEQANSSLASHSTTSQRRRRPAATGRSKVIDDLDQLLRSAPSSTAPPGHSYSTSPTESYLSCSNASKAGAHEFDYSTLCRDEFSSFIKVEGAVADDHWPQAGRNVHKPSRAGRQASESGAGRGHAHPHRSGPMLVGVHESGQRQQRESVVNMSHASPASSPRSRDSCSPVEFPFTTRQPGQYEDEVEVEEEFSEASSGSYLWDHSNSSNLNDPELVLLSAGGESENLSELLDTYMERMSCLLRLAKGEHQTVSMEEAFGRAEREIEVSEEFRTAIEYAPLHRPRLARIVQEVVEAPLFGCDGDEEKDEEKLASDCEPPNSGARPRLRVRTELASGAEAIRALQCSVQTSAKLNWDHEQIEEGERCAANIGAPELRAQLEAALAARLMQDLEPGTGASQGELLVKTVRRHLSDFIENYNTYQRELRANTSFANDWHTNWLFAYKRPEDGQGSQGGWSGAKRAKMGADEEEEEEEAHQIDLIRYATLLANKYTPVKLTYLARASAGPAEREIEHFYEAQEAQADELQWRARESSRQTDACRLLLCDDLDDSEGEEADDDGKRKRSRKTRAREQPLRVNYSSSLAAARGIFERQLRFPAYGYLLESPVVRVPLAGARWPQAGQRNGQRNGQPEAKLRRLKLAILNRLRRVTLGEPRPSLQEAGEQVRFLVKLANVELINRLPVIQFCAKVSGPLPISVRWYRSSGAGQATREEEISCLRTSVYGNVKLRKNLIIREQGAALEGKKLRGDQEEDIFEPWPIEMHANYDFEYQNEWSSWFRFRRRQGEILFDIREASAEHDYGQTYRCVIQNYCSRRECTFSLTARSDKIEANDGNEVRSKCAVRRGKKKTGRGESGHALLRTWSQRTLHKPQPETREPLAAANELERLMLPIGGGELAERRPETQCADASGANCKSWQQTVGRRSAFTLDADKFGKDFPYHPENLLKRLEENKLTVKCKPALRTAGSAGNKLPEQQQRRLQNAMGEAPGTAAAAAAAATGRSSPTASEAKGERAKLAPDFQMQSDEDEALDFGQRQLVLSNNNSPQESQAAPEQEQQLERQQKQKQQQQESSLSGQQASNSDQAKEQPTRAPKPRSRLRAAAACANQGGEPAGKPAGQLSSRFTDGQGRQQAQERQHGDGQLRPQAAPAVTVAKSDLRPKQQVQEACCSLGGVKLNSNSNSNSNSNNTNTANETGQPQPPPASGTRSNEAEWIPRANVKSLISRFS